MLICVIFDKFGGPCHKKCQKAFEWFPWNLSQFENDPQLIKSNSVLELFLWCYGKDWLYRIILRGMEAHLLSVRTENKCANIRKTISCIYNKLFKSSLPIPFNLCFLGWCDMPFEPFRNLKRWQRQNKIPFVMLLCKCFPLLCKSHYRKRSGEIGGKGNYSNCHDMPSKS